MAKAKDTPSKDKPKRGRPTLYTPELAALICERVATSTLGLYKLCAMYEDMPDKTTINLWRYKYPEFSTLYTQAKMVQADLLAEECLLIADDDSKDTKVNALTGEEICNTEFIARSRLRIDTRKWLAAKLLPKQYGRPAEEVPKSTEEKKALVSELIDKLMD